MKAAAALLTGGSCTRGCLVTEQRAGLAEVAMGMNVDGLDALAVHHHRQLLPRRLRVRVMHHAAAAKHDAGRKRRP